jgi:CRISPR/Cas system endoribonuclease Cas6 (RAMP superfamily)
MVGGFSCGSLPDQLRQWSVVVGEVVSGSKYFGVSQVETLATPEFQKITRFKFLLPQVASVGESADGQRFTKYFRPKDPVWSERVQQNLLAKYSAWHSTVPEDDRLRLVFDAKYLEQHRGTKLGTYKDGIRSWEPLLRSF